MSLHPTADLFAQGSPKFDTTRLAEYARGAPSSTDGAYAGGGTGFQITTWSFLGALYSGWFGQGQAGPGPWDPGISGTPAVQVTSSGGTRQPALWMPRQLGTYTDVEVEVSFQEMSQNSSQLHSAGGARRSINGVAARLAGATLTSSGTSSTHHAGGDGYFFGWCFDNSLAVGGGKYVLWRVNGGVVTRLADSPTGATTSTSWVASQPWIPRRLKMQVQTSGATVVLTCSVLVGGADPIDPPPPLFTFVDSSGSRLTAAGRVGFFASGEESTSAIWTATSVNYFRAGPIGGVPDLLEEFDRYNAQAGAVHVAGADAAFTGYDLSNGWFGDSLSAASPGALVEDDTHDRAQVTRGFAGTFTRQRPADDPVTQDREVLVRFAGTGTVSGVRAAGPALRVTHPAGVGLAARTSYDFVLEYADGAATARYVLYRTRASVRVELASTGATYTTDADIVLALSAQNNSGGRPVLRGYDAGVQVVLELPAVPVPGVQIGTDGTVIDTTSAAVLSGAGQGFYAAVPSACTKALYVDSFDEAALVTVALAERDMASRSVPAEDDGLTGTLALPDSWPVQELSAVSAVLHDLDLGNRYGSLADSTIGRAWTVSIPPGPDAERQAFRDFLRACRGPQVPFHWLPPGDLAVVPVRFRNVQVDFQLVSLGPNAWAGSFELEELVAS